MGLRFSLKRSKYVKSKIKKNVNIELFCHYFAITVGVDQGFSTFALKSHSWSLAPPTLIKHTSIS